MMRALHPRVPSACVRRTRACCSRLAAIFGTLVVPLILGTVPAATADEIVIQADGKHFSDRRIHQALAHAVDWTTVLQRAGLATNSAVTLKAERIATPLTRYGYDPERSKRYLAEAGFPNGFAFVLVHGPSTKSISSMLSSYWRQVAINARLSGVSRDADIASTFKGIAFDNGHVMRIEIARAPPSQPKTPDIRGQTPASAQNTFRIRTRVRGNVATTQYRAGTIANQSPVAGTILPRDRTINIWIAQAERVPNIVGSDFNALLPSFARKKIRLERVGEFHAPERAGTILRQDPAAGALMPSNRRVRAWVSLGTRLAPDILGLTVREAETRHSNIKLKVEELARVPSDLAFGHIVEQEPRAGEPLPASSLISVAVSAGPSTVPSLIGLMLDDARRDAGALDMKVVRSGERHDDRTIGIVVDQDPPAGAPLPANRRVAVWTSRGPLLTPDLLGMIPSDSEQKYVDIGLHVRVTSQAHEPGVSEGLIIAQDPKAGSRFPKDGTVQVMISLGPETVPDLVGQMLDDARRDMRALDMKVVPSGERHDDRAIGIIVDQDPPARTRMPANRRVAVWTSRGPLLTPDLLGMIPSDSEQKYVDIGLHVRVTSQAHEPGVSEGLIIAQDPKAGSRFPKDGTVQVMISLGPETVPDLLGMSLLDAQSRYPSIDIALDSEVNDPLREGSILEQSPLAGDPLPADRRVDVHTSLGPSPPRLWPDLEPWQWAAAGVAGVLAVFGTIGFAVRRSASLPERPVESEGEQRFEDFRVESHDNLAERHIELQTHDSIGLDLRVRIGHDPGEQTIEEDDPPKEV